MWVCSRLTAAHLLAGLPILVKDLTAVKGLLFTQVGFAEARNHTLTVCTLLHVACSVQIASTAGSHACHGHREAPYTKTT